MGLNIHVEDHSRCLERYCVTSQPEWWDSGRHTGDVDFYLADWEWIYIHAPHDEPGKRPVNFELARAWVRENIDEYNQPRLLEALDKVEADSSLWFNGVW